MYKKNDIRRLYWLIEEYLKGSINEATFCDEFYYSYDLEIDKISLNDIEKSAFSELGKVTSRFSQHEDDHKLDARAFVSAEELRKKVIETKEKLKG